MTKNNNKGLSFGAKVLQNAGTRMERGEKSTAGERQHRLDKTIGGGVGGAAVGTVLGLGARAASKKGKALAALLGGGAGAGVGGLLGRAEANQEINLHRRLSNSRKSEGGSTFGSDVVNKAGGR